MIKLLNTPAALAFCEAVMAEAERQEKQKAADVAPSRPEIPV